MEMSAKLYNGDCLDIMMQLPEASVDMVFCDLPYEVTPLEWDIIIPPEKLWECWRRVTKPSAAIVLTATQPFTTLMIASNYKDFKYCWYWQKRNITGFMHAKKQPLRCIEDIPVFYRKFPTYNPQGVFPFNRRYLPGTHNKLFRAPMRGPKAEKGRVQEFTNYPRQVLDIPYEYSKLHPTQKPVALIEYLIKTYTNEGDVVLDNCMGSGSTGVAAANCKRDFIGIEKSEEYFQFCVQRIPDHEVMAVAPRKKVKRERLVRERLT